MTHLWETWNHILKLDPDKTLHANDTYEAACQTGTDAIAIGGTFDITTDKTQRVLDACAKYDVPLYQEPSNPAVVVHDDRLEGYLIPTVLNAGTKDWLIDAHKEWVRIDSDIPWSDTFMEAYIVLNPDAGVAEYTDANCDLRMDDIAAYAHTAEQFFGQDIIYLEYSGTLGDPNIVKSVQNTVEDATVFYGGGIHDYDSAYERAQYADTIIVGNALYDHGVDAIQETVDAAHDAN